LPGLLRNLEDRRRLVTLVQRLLADERVQRAKPSNEQLAMIDNIGETLSVSGAAGPAARASRKPVRKRSRRAARKPVAKARA